MNSVQNGILPSAPSSEDNANISSRKAKPLKIRPRPNLRGIDGFFVPIFTQIQAMIGASTMMAMEFTDWNQPVGKVHEPNWRLTISSARKVKELPACSKNIQNRMLKTKISSIAMVLSRDTAPSLMPSASSRPHNATNIGVSTYHCSVSAEIDRRK